MTMPDLKPLTRTAFESAGRGFAHGRTLVMGVLNVTPDSFSDGGVFHAPGMALAHGLRMAGEGADILDIGAESTRPGHVAVDADDEIARIEPVLKALVPLLPCPVSVDTMKAKVAERALRLGASIINDVWGLQRDPDVARVAAAYGAAVIVMHNREAADSGLDIVADVLAFLSRSIEIALAAGIPQHRIAVDPGIGFGKTFEQNVVLVRELHLLNALRCPILVGASRKSMIGRIVPVPPQERLAGTLAVHTAAILNGASIVRVHDVAEGVQAARVADALKTGVAA